jgi:hypothetical protein
MEQKYLEVIPEESKEMFSSISSIMDKFQSGHSRIQIENFILNDIEYPTAYGKFQQACVEMVARLSRVIDSYFDIKETEIKIKMKNEKLTKASGFQKELVGLELEKLQLQLRLKQASLKDIVRETMIFFEVYQSHPEFHNLTTAEEAQLEQEQWAQKALNLPLVFEERYGPEVLKQMWGPEVYEKFTEIRQKTYGMLPREMFERKKLKE